jgi:hypothetical protein
VLLCTCKPGILELCCEALKVFEGVINLYGVKKFRTTGSSSLPAIDSEENVFRLGTQLGLTRSITLAASSFVNFGDVKTVTPGTTVSTGNYQLFGFEASLAWKPRKRWTTALTYDFTRRESVATSVAGTSNNYTQNSIAFSVSYAF